MVLPVYEEPPALPGGSYFCHIFRKHKIFAETPNLTLDIGNASAYNIYVARMAHPGVAQLVARLVRDQEAVGSNPATRTRKTPETMRFQGFYFFACTRFCTRLLIFAANNFFECRGTIVGYTVKITGFEMAIRCFCVHVFRVADSFLFQAVRHFVID